MNSFEYKSIPLEFKDVDKSKRTALIAHATFDNIDLANDVIRKGAFDKTWKENKSDIAYYLNHDDNQSPGVITNVYADDVHAYTEVKNGTHTLGNDVNIMMDEGVIKKASFGYIVTRANKAEIKSKKVREIKELYHGETSVLTKLACNPGSRVISHTKAFGSIPNIGNLEFKTLSQPEQDFLTQIISAGNSGLMAAITLANSLSPDSDLYTYINYFISQSASQLSDLKGQLKYGRKSFDGMKETLTTYENFIRNTTASDECIQNVQKEADEIKALILTEDTAGTHDDAPPVSDSDQLAWILRLQEAI